VAQLSEQQTAGISQVHTGIDQVAQVISANSATAEQSAAASEEMSGQAVLLEELVSQFKLDEGRRGIRPSSKQLSLPEKTAF